LSWLGEHGSSVVKVARAYTLTNDECQEPGAGDFAASVAVIAEFPG